MTTTTDTDVWVRRFQPTAEAPIRLMCFPHAGGSASYFAPIARALTPSIDVLAMQYPGRQDRRREPTIESIPELADRIFEALRGYTDREFAFLGHSMGASVAFEVAHRLENELGCSPSILWASARQAPSIPMYSRVHLRTDAGVLAELRRLSGTEAALYEDEELMRSFLPAIRGDYKALETYLREPDVRVGCPITVLLGDADPITGREQASAWRVHTTGEFALRVLPGGHFYLTERYAEVAGLVSGSLAEER
jgi:pyochelin biosynthesis protein PchC